MKHLLSCPGMAGLALFVSSLAPAAAKIETLDSTDDWKAIRDTDDFTGQVTCEVATTATGDGPHIVFVASHEIFDPHGVVIVAAKHYGVGMTYTVDQNESKTFGYSHHSETAEYVYLFTGTELAEMVADFRRGDSLSYQAHSSRKFIDDSKDRISLDGFGRLWDKALACNF